MNTTRSIERQIGFFSKRVIVLSAAFRSVTHCLTFCLLGLLFLSCEQTAQYYETLRNQPEFLKNYDAVYSVGDTMLITGRLNRNSLQITIGNADAEIISITDTLHNMQYNDTVQVAHLLISREMGIGTNRPVNITSSGITVEGPSIEIVENANSGFLPGELTVEKIADYPTGTTPIYCRSGNGNLYFLDNTTYAVTRMLPNGSTEKVFDTSECVDADGTAFTFTRFNSCGIDPNERYLYLSLYTEAPARTYWHYYRLCRWDMVKKEFTVLNKTPYYIYRSGRKLSDVQPFEGNIANVKIFTASAIYPDSKGNVFFNMNNQMITRLDANGNYTYIFKNAYGSYVQVISDPAPQIVDPETEEYYTPTRNRQFFPGVIINFSNVRAFSPDENLLYVRSTLSMLQLYDMNNQVLVSEHNKSLGTNQKPFISGSFDVLTGTTGGIITSNISMWGFLPLPERKLLILYYQDLNEQYARYGVPAWGVLDFVSERGYRYAHGLFDRKGYVMEATDQLLNYDADGMLYMTADNRTAILKTVFK